MIRLDPQARAALGDDAPPASRLAMRVVVEAARLVGAQELVAVTSAHIDGCLYHGDAAVHFVERLRDLGGHVTVPATLNVGALDLLHPEVVRAPAHEREMARRLMQAHVDLGCRATWTCAPYQAGHRPRLGEHVAWAESNAVVFANSVLGARTNRNGDFLDICAAITGRVPLYGLHTDAGRLATVHVDLCRLRPALLREAAFYPVLGAWLGAEVGGEVAVIEGLPTDIPEDWLKALGAGAASTGAVGLFHAVGVTPEAPDVATACGGAPVRRLVPDPATMRAARDRLSTTDATRVDCIALGSPHFSLGECRALAALLDRGRQSAIPVYVCTRRDVLAALERDGLANDLRAAGVRFVVDTCVVVTPILPADGHVLMTNSAKFAHYAPANCGYDSVYGSLADCARTAATGRLERDEASWT